MNQLPSVRAIFWDNDGILVETEPLYFEANQRTLAPLGIDLNEELYRRLFLIEGRGAWHLLDERGFSEAEIESLRQQRNALYSDLIRARVRVLPGVVDVLDALHGRFSMAVVTSSRRDHFDLIHERTGLLKYFDFVVAGGDYARSKPDPAPYIAALERSGLSPEDCIAIEDSERGLESAARAGIRCIVVPTALTRRSAFERAIRIAENLGDVPALLSELAGTATTTLHRAHER